MRLRQRPRDTGATRLPQALLLGGAVRVQRHYQGTVGQHAPADVTPDPRAVLRETRSCMCRTRCSRPAARRPPLGVRPQDGKLHFISLGKGPVWRMREGMGVPPPPHRQCPLTPS